MATSDNQNAQQLEQELRPQSRSESGKIDILSGIVLVLSLLLIVYISYDTFMNIPFLSNHKYMTFQFWVCVAFLLDFFIDFAYARNKKEYLKRRWFFFFISIPYLNLVNSFNITVPADILFFLRFIPLVRRLLALDGYRIHIHQPRGIVDGAIHGNPHSPCLLSGTDFLL